jgi:predicted SAM-dependent methyltransferase
MKVLLHSIIILILSLLLLSHAENKDVTTIISRKQVAICITTTSASLEAVDVESSNFNYAILGLNFNSSTVNFSPFEYCSRSIRMHERSLQHLEYVLFFPNDFIFSDQVSWQKVVRVLDLNVLKNIANSKHCNVWQVAYGQHELNTIFFCMRRIILDFLDGIGSYFPSSAHHIDQHFDILISENFSMSMNCFSVEISENVFENIWVSIDGNRTSIPLYEQDIRTMYELHSNSPTLTKLMGVLSLHGSNIGDAATYFYRSCELSDFRDAATLIEYANNCQSVDQITVLDSLRKGLQRTGDLRLLQLMIAIHNSNNDNVHHWEDIKMALKISPSNYDVWLLFIDFALTHEVMVKLQDQTLSTFPTITASQWIQYYNAGLSYFPSCPALLYLRAMQYFDSGDLPCAARLLSDALRYRNLTTSAFMQSILADGVVMQNYEWIMDRWHLGQNMTLSKTDSTWENPSLPEGVYDSCFPLRRINTVGLHPIHEEALRDAMEVLGLAPSKIACPLKVGQTLLRSPSLGEGCLALQVGCSVHNTCARLPWIVLDAVASLSTWIQSAAHDLSHIRSASVHYLYCSHTLEHLQHYGNQNSMVILALREWNRVLVPNGWLMLAVPDMEAIARIISSHSLSRLHKAVMGRIIYGGQDSPYNHHYTAFYADFLYDLLLANNFCDIQRVDSLGLFDDNSEINFNSWGSISLNVVAKRCPMREHYTGQT